MKRVLTGQQRWMIEKARQRSKRRKKKVIVIPRHTRRVHAQIPMRMRVLANWDTIDNILSLILQRLDRTRRTPADRKCAENIIALLEDSLLADNPKCEGG